MLAPNTIAVTRQPYNFMPVGNPIQYLIQSNRTHEWSEYGCSVGPVIPSQYGVWELYIDFIPADGDALYIDNEVYIFRNCNPRQLANVIDISVLLSTMNFCNFALEIIETINNNPRARNKYFISPLGVPYSFGSSTCNVSNTLTVYIVAKKIGLDLNPRYEIALTSTQTPLQIIALPQATYYNNYRVKIIPYMESTEHNYLQFVELPTLSALPKFQSAQGVNHVVDPERDFEFDIRNLLKIYLDEDIPTLDLFKVQFAQNCIKRVFVRYGDTYNQRADIGGFEAFASKLKTAQEFRVLNASFDLYHSNLYTHRIENGFTCVPEYTQEYLLKDFFEPDLITDQRFLTNWKNKTLYKNDYEFLYFWIKIGVDLSYLQATLDVTYNNGSSATLVGAYNFADYAICDAPAQTDEQVIMIPLHIILNEFDMRNVKRFCFYLTHPDCFVPAGYGASVIVFISGGFIFSLTVGTCLNFNFNLAGCNYPQGDTPEALAASFYDIMTNCPSPTLESLRASGTFKISYTPGSPSVTLYVKDCCSGHFPITPVLDNADTLYAATAMFCCGGLETRVQISEKLTYNYNFLCIEERVGMMYLNALGVNEMFYFNGALIKQLQADRTEYLRNILNNDETRNLPNDREQVTISADGEWAYELQTILETDEERELIKEFFHSPRVRLLQTTCIKPQCGEEAVCLPCNTDANQHFTPYAPSEIVERCNYYLDLDKANIEYVQYADIPAYHWGCEDVTFEAWIRPKTFSSGSFFDWSIIVAKQGAGTKEENNPAVFFFYNAAGSLAVLHSMRRVGATTNAYLGFTPGGSIALGNWYHVAWVRPANTILSTDQLVYVNGVLLPITSLTDTLLPGDCSLYQDPLNPARVNNGPVVVGADFDCLFPKSPEHWNGGMFTSDMHIAGLRIYRRALSQLELQTNYNLGLSKCPSFAVSNPASLVLNSTFNQSAGYSATDFAVGNSGALVPLGTYDVPVNTELTGCTPTNPQTFGYPAARVAQDGGAWIPFTTDEFVCCSEVPLETVCKDTLQPIQLTDKNITVLNDEGVTEFTLKFQGARTHNALRGA